MHENANIAYQIKETQSILSTIMESQPQTSGGTEGQQTDDIVLDLAEVVTNSIITKIGTEDANVNMFKVALYLLKHLTIVSHFLT